jgi:DNA-binding NarL/FixJ family response regulator
MKQDVSVSNTVVVADLMPLRRAEIMSFLQHWADSVGVTLLDLDPRLLTEIGNCHGCRMFILNVGAQSVDTPEPAPWLEAVHAAAPDAPIVVISDREEAGEIVAAFRYGVRGYIPASIEPTLALQALTFILNGGQFFPPNALLEGLWRPGGGPSGRLRVRKAGEPGESDGGLTARQQDVLDLLRLGRSNKLIARELKMCEATVKVHVRQILRRLGASNRTQAALMSAAIKLNGADPPASVELR